MQQEKDNHPVDARFNMAGSFDSFMTDHWIIDSGVTNHITFNNDWLVDMRLNNTPFQFACCLEADRAVEMHNNVSL